MAKIVSDDHKSNLGVITVCLSDVIIFSVWCFHIELQAKISQMDYYVDNSSTEIQGSSKYKRLHLTQGNLCLQFI